MDDESLDQGEEEVVEAAPEEEEVKKDAPPRVRDEKGRFKRTSMRDQMMNSLIENRKKTVSREIVPEEEEPVHEDVAPAPVRVKVYDQEFDVDQEAIDAAGGLEPYQKLAAANYKLEQAKQRNAEAAAMMEENARLNQELKHRLQEPLQPTPQRKTPGEDGLTDEQREYLAKLSEDYPDEIVETRRDLYILQNSKGDDDVVKRATDRAVTEMRGQERAREQAAANALFTEKYSHIEQDHYLNAIAQAEARQLLSEDPNRDLRDVVIKAGNKAQEYYEKLQGSTFENKQARKRAAGNPPSGGSKRLPSKPEVRPPTAQEVIAEMRAARGLAS